MAGAEFFTWAGIGICAGASFFFALAETALFSLGKWRVKDFAARFPEKGRAVARLLESPEELLGTIVLGNTFANAGIVALSVWLGWHDAARFWAALGGAFVLILFGCEVLPKTLAVRAPELWALQVVTPLLILLRLSRPLRTIAIRLDEVLIRVTTPASFRRPQHATDEDYQELLEVAYQQGALGLSEKEFISRIIHLDRRTVSEVMKPRAMMVSISDELTQEEMIEAARRHKHRRLPIFDETPDTIVGILNSRALLLHPDIDLSEAIEFPSFVPESMNLLQLLKSLQRQRRGMAIVMDEFGGTAGLVTQEDILEAVIGGLRREGEPEVQLLESLGEGRWRVDGRLRLEDFRRSCQPELETIPEVETVGGLLLSKMEVVPVPGQSAVVGGLRFTVQSADERRIGEVLVEVLKKKGSS